MKNRILLKAKPQKAAIVLLIFTLISLFIIFIFTFSVDKDCMKLNSLIRSGYEYSATMQEPVLKDDYYQFNAGIDFALSSDSQTSLNADIIMQTDKSNYTDLVYWNANIIDTHSIAISKNIANKNDLHLGDKLYSKHIVNGEVCEYAIEQIIPESLCVRADKDNKYSNGIIIMGYDAEYVNNITHNCIVFTNENIDELTAKSTSTPQNIIYRDDEIRNAVISIIPYSAFFSLIAIVATIISVYILTKGVSCNFRRLVMLGFEKKKLNHAYHNYVYMTGIAYIIIALVLSGVVFLSTDISPVRIMLVVWIPLMELITLFIATSISNKRLWRK